MQPRQRSKCSTTVSVSGIVPSTRLAHQVDAAARRVHLLVPERVGRARRQAEAAVDAVGDQLGLHDASERSDDAFGERAPGLDRLALDVGDARAGPDERRGAAVPAHPPVQVGLQRAHLGPRLGRPRRRAPSPARARLRAPPSKSTSIRSPTMSTALGTSPEWWRLAQRSAPTATVRAAAGQRMQPERDALDAAEPAARAAEELAEVVARDVLHDLAARARARAVEQRDGDADHEVAHRAEAVAQRPGEIVEQAVAERRVAGRVEREALAVLAERRLQLGEQQAAPRRCTSGRRARARGSELLRSALQVPPAPAGGRGAARAPRRRGAASGTACRGSRGRPGRTPCAGASSPRGRPR